MVGELTGDGASVRVLELVRNGRGATAAQILRFLERELGVYKHLLPN